MPRKRSLVSLPPVPPDFIKRAARYELRGWRTNGGPAVSAAEKERWIYFLQGDDGGPIKIGQTNNIAQRISTVQCGYPFGCLSYVGLLLDVIGAERMLHARFSGLRMVGEWFKPEAELVNHVLSLSLPEIPDA